MNMYDRSDWYVGKITSVGEVYDKSDWPVGKITSEGKIYDKSDWLEGYVDNTRNLGHACLAALLFLSLIKLDDFDI